MILCYEELKTKILNNFIQEKLYLEILFVYGGCDFHGTIKPDIDIGVGYGKLRIPTSILDNWITKVSLFA